MNPAAYFAAHKPLILGGGAAAVAALGLYQRKKNAAAKATGATVPGAIPAAAVVGTGNSAATYDSTAFDIYDALQQQIGDLAAKQQTSSPPSGASATPKPATSHILAPIASGLLAPTYNGHYVRFTDGNIAEVEKDGSTLWLSPTESKRAFAKTGGNWAKSGLVDQVNTKHPANEYSVGQNLAARNAAFAKKK